MTRDQILTILREVLAESFDIPPDKVTDEATFRGTLGMDSFATVDLILLLGKRFDIRTEVEDFAELYTVGKVADHIAAVKGRVATPST